MSRVYAVLAKYWLAILGFVIILFYLTNAFQIIDYPDQVFTVLFLAISPVAIIGVYAIGKRLAQSRHSLGIDLAKIYGIIAFGIFEMMLCIQFGSRTYFREHLLNDAKSDVSNEIVKTIYKGVNAVQFTMDIAFDIFYCLMIVLFSVAMFRNNLFGKALGVFGVVSGLGLLTLNLWTFPYPPGESGLIDLGPLTGIWWIWVLFILIKIERREKYSGN